MDRTVSTYLHKSLQTIGADVKQLRALDQICQAYVRLDGSAGDGLTGALQKLHAAADELVRHARSYQKEIAEIMAAVNPEEVRHAGNQRS